MTNNMKFLKNFSNRTPFKKIDINLSLDSTPFQQITNTIKKVGENLRNSEVKGTQFVSNGGWNREGRRRGCLGETTK